MKPLPPEAAMQLLEIRGALVAQLILVIVLAVLLVMMRRLEPASRFYATWVGGWAAHAVYLAAATASLLDAVREAPALRTTLLGVSMTAGLAHLAWIAWGADVRRRGGTPAAAGRWRAAVIGAFVLGAVLFAVTFDMPRTLGQGIRQLPRQAISVGVYAFAAASFWAIREQLGRTAATSLVIGFATWSVTQFLYTMNSVGALVKSLAPGFGNLRLIENAEFAVLAYLDVAYVGCIGLGVVFELIEQRERSTQRLAAVSSQLRTIVEASPVAIFSLDARGRLQLANPAAATLFGWRVNPPQPPLPVDAATVAPPWNQALAGGETRQEVREFETADRRRISASVAAAPVRGPGGALAGAIVVIADLTEQRRLEHAARHAQKMEAVGRLAGGIAHDFNNLLTAMLGALHLAEGDLEPGHPAHESILEVRDAAKRAADLTTRLLNFSRRERKARHVLDVALLLGDLHRLLRRLIGERIELVLDVEPALPSVIADRSEIEQVVTNLAVNARDAIGEGRGTVTLAARRVVLEHPLTGLLAEAAPGTFVRIDVADTGCGMDPATLGRMFEPFYTTKEPGRGTGLGLATVYAILEETGGQLRVASQVGQGSTFSLFLRSA